ncbi:MAG TPA: GAF domain-containing sensor histidine kinase [Gemmatimonadaceae bacterium]|nr:GAF domain-containing sensor histidine kinase [Gemmatimonadaceae bacterium]
MPSFPAHAVAPVFDEAGYRMNPDVGRSVDVAVDLPIANESKAAMPNAARTDRAVPSTRTEATLAARLAAAFAESLIGTIVFDAKGRPVAMNAAFERLWGATLADVPTAYSILEDTQLKRAGMLDDIHRVFDGESVRLSPLQYDMQAAMGCGQGRSTQAHLYPVRGFSGDVEHVVVMHFDVALHPSRESAPDRIVGQAARLQTLSDALSTASTMNQVADAVVMHAPAVFGAAGTVIAQLTGDGRYLEIVRAGAMPEDVEEAWRRFPVSSPVPMADVARSGEALFLESREDWVARYPQLLPVLERTGQHANAVMPLVVDGRVLGVLGAAFGAPNVFDDEDRAVARAVALQCAQALERARLFEAEREAREEAEAANRAKAQFLAVMSHELRTPLNAIGGYAELIEMGIRGPVTPEQCEDLRRIRVSQRHLLGLINEVLNYAKVETGAVHYDLSDVNVRDALRAAEALVAPQAHAKAIPLTVGDCPRELAVRADTEKLRQILVNLLGNAIKFSTRDGRIDLAWEASGEYVRIHVSDAGIGIPPHKLGAIFEPFVQVRSDLTRTADGVGLGLAISRDLARAMGGDITVESSPGTGSRFTLLLPAAKS